MNQGITYSGVVFAVLLPLAYYNTSPPACQVRRFFHTFSNLLIYEGIFLFSHECRKKISIFPRVQTFKIPTSVIFHSWEFFKNAVKSGFLSVQKFPQVQTPKFRPPKNRAFWCRKIPTSVNFCGRLTESRPPANVAIPSFSALLQLVFFSHKCIFTYGNFYK